VHGLALNLARAPHAGDHECIAKPANQVVGFTRAAPDHRNRHPREFDADLEFAQNALRNHSARDRHGDHGQQVRAGDDFVSP